MYFWLQAFGINPVVKHTPTEFTAVSALLWLPVSFLTILLYNSAISLSKLISTASQIWTLDALKAESSNLYFLVIFLCLSGIVSLIASIIWAKWVHPLVQNKIINRVREWRGLAPFSSSSSVWDEVFAQNDSQVVEIGRIDKSGMSMIGCIKKASRTFEPERHLHLEDVTFFTELVKNYPIPESHVFYDTKSGSYVKIFDAEAIYNAQVEDRQKAELQKEPVSVTSSLDQQEK